MSISFSKPTENSHSTANPKMISRWKANANPLMTYATRREVRDTTAFVNLNPVTDSAMPRRGNSMPWGNKMERGKTETRTAPASKTTVLASVTAHSHFVGASADHV